MSHDDGICFSCYIWKFSICNGCYSFVMSPSDCCHPSYSFPLLFPQVPFSHAVKYISLVIICFAFSVIGDLELNFIVTQFFLLSKLLGELLIYLYMHWRSRLMLAAWMQLCSNSCHFAFYCNSVSVLCTPQFNLVLTRCANCMS